MDIIDLRSDTVTWPTERMRRAMADARVGDDVFGEDPTVRDLEARSARRFGKEAAVFVASGTMGNLVSLLAHCGRGERAIMGDRSHTHMFEGGNPATFGGVQPWPVPVDPDGTMALSALRQAISRTDDYHYPLTRAISVENTQGGRYGQPLPVDYVREVEALCREHGLKLHVDGARIFNAAAALDTDAADLGRGADTLTICLSKGLCAPMGSVVVGAADVIDRARRVRKALGGGMRQAGIMAAAGIIALEEMTGRLHEDHATARMLADGLAALPWFTVDLDRARTNMVFCELTPDAPLTAPELSRALRADGIAVVPRAGSLAAFRLVTHYWIKPEHADLALTRIAHHLAAVPARAR
jgi:threonine aldolase